MSIATISVCCIVAGNNTTHLNNIQKTHCCIPMTTFDTSDNNLEKRMTYRYKKEIIITLKLTDTQFTHSFPFTYPFLLTPHTLSSHSLSTLSLSLSLIFLPVNACPHPVHIFSHPPVSKSHGIPTLIPNVSARHRSAVSITRRPPFPAEGTPVPIKQQAV